MVTKPTLPRNVPAKTAGALGHRGSAPVGASSREITAEDVINYLVRASLAERWAILCRVAVASSSQELQTNEPAPASTPRYVCPPGGITRKPLELVDLTAAAIPEPSTGSMTDAVERLFSSMHALNELESASEGARFCLNAALQTVPCLAALVHVRHQPTGDLVVLHARGPGAESLVGTRTPQTDPIVAQAFRSARPVVATYAADKPGSNGGAVCVRHKSFDPWSVAFVPVLFGGQLLGLIEMIDPTDGAPFSDARQSALAYVAEKLGAFLAAHGTDSSKAPQPG
jgi:GAF domain-containing protein